jgi:oxalyl-CoA decarboxylase
MEVETICRYDLPVCVVVFNNNGIYKGTDTNPRGTEVAPTVFVKNAKYDMLMQAFGGVGVRADNPEQLKKALDEAIASGKPTLINAIIDETAGTESGRITSLNPAMAKKKRPEAGRATTHSLSCRARPGIQQRSRTSAGLDCGSSPQ